MLILNWVSKTGGLENCETEGEIELPHVFSITVTSPASSSLSPSPSGICIEVQTLLSTQFFSSLCIFWQFSHHQAALFRGAHQKIKEDSIKKKQFPFCLISGACIIIK